MLISQGIKGENLHEVLTDPAKADRIDQLDPLAFSELILASLLVNFEDAKPDNFILELLPQGTYRLIGIDNDHAFVPPLVKEGSSTVQVKCILYCHDLMQKPIHPCAKERSLLTRNICCATGWSYWWKKISATAHCSLKKSVNNFSR